MTSSRHRLVLLLPALLLGMAGCATSVTAQPAPAGPPWPERSLRSTGTVKIPVLMVRFQGTTKPFDAPRLQDHLFEDTSGTTTLTDYYREASYGRFELQGDVHGWYALRHPVSHYTQGCNHLCLEAHDEIADLVGEAVGRARSGGVDFRLYDNDGPDGLPDSGDDDGLVDVLMIVHSLQDPDCSPSGPRIDSFHGFHQKYWNLQVQGRYLDTGVPGHGGGTIAVNDFILLPGRHCQKSDAPHEIGDYAHELGHALGLPDLVDQDQSSGGIGPWSLMAAGNYGGDGRSSDTPTHLSAWSKERLGWLAPRIATAAGTYRLKPVETHPDVIRIPFLDGSLHQYYLLEFRSQIGFDAELPGSGLLVWRINGTAVEEWDHARRKNTDLHSVNDDDVRKGVVLIEADGRNDLADCRPISACSGDDGDPFPGSASTTSFDYDSEPRSFGDIGLCNIKSGKDEVEFQLAVQGDCP